MTMFSSQWFANVDSEFDSTLIGNSVWLDGSSDYLDRSTSSFSTNEVTMACWFQISAPMSSGGEQLLSIGNNSASGAGNSGVKWENGLTYFSADGYAVKSTAEFRDDGWYHILASFKLDEATASNKGKFYINGEEITNFSLDQRSSWATTFSNTSKELVGAMSAGYGKVYIAQPIILDGQSIQGGDFSISNFVDTQTFGTNGSQIIPKADADIAALASSAGGNSFCLDFSDSSALGNDISSNNNDLTANSMSSTNQSVHTPSLVFPILSGVNGQLTEVSNLEYGNRLAVGSANWYSVFASKSMGKTGKYYYETRIHTDTGANGFPSCIHDAATASRNYAYYIGYTTSSYGLGYGMYSGDGKYYTNGTQNTITGAATMSAGDIIMLAVDLDNDKVWWGENGTWYDSGNPATNTGGISIQSDTEYVFGTSTSASEDYFVNFGADSTFGGAETAGGNSDTNGVGNFQYAVPSGFQCLASTSQSTPDYQGADYFQATTYTGNGTAIGSGGKAITGTGFQPDWVWMIDRSAARSHAWYDIVRGTTKQLECDVTAAETTESEGLTTFGSDGFTVGSLAQVNTNNENFVAWQWLGSNSTSTNSNGSLNTTVTAADANHFSIVGWTQAGTAAAQTLGHGLSGAPEAIIVKNRTDATSWPVYSEVTGNTKYLPLETSGAPVTSNVWQNTSPTSTVFSVSNDNITSGSANDQMIAYCFRSVPGLLKVGEYGGNGSTTNGPYIYLGFTPRWIMIKNNYTSGYNWMLWDTARSPYNKLNQNLWADLAGGESTSSTYGRYIFSNGFKPDGSSHGIVNASGHTYLYIAIADIAGNGTLPPIYGR
jgi:hypothetical protein